ncbi:hypothetical protein HPO_09915 [Hyphomonas polymorpha PS728]|uniref:DUF3137 domain-containing protein n=1 Tax=Hyphomonas polymorpha PS728 TaxID=1280954 RepID=A0A062VK87_9PROT|nr:DUF3137 domain-containing protein [Hyphomonas polymorpha]KCZ98520.1 hypothetical protein HPO_09915 [Hyphomonas polymorpha PS728]
MGMGWDDIEKLDGFAGLRAHAEATVLPILESADLKAGDGARLKGRISRAFFGGFIAFIVCFFLVEAFTPGTWWGEALTFILFPLLFFGCILGSLFLFRNSLIRLLLDAKSRLLLRAKALSALGAPLGLSYVAVPGGMPLALKWLSDQSWAPGELKEAAQAMEQAGGMEDAVAAARDAGLMIESNVYVVGSAEQKAQYQEAAARQRQVEDGFHGRRAGIDFELFEWVERVEDAPSIHHLVIVLEAPFLLHGVTQLRARKTGWPQGTASGFADVDLGPRAFGELYRLRATDQVEARAIFNPAVIERVIALAEGGAFRAVGKGNRLVFDFPGGDRFALIDLVTGAWSPETLERTVGDLAAALALVDTLAHAFMLARKSDTGGE